MATARTRLEGDGGFSLIVVLGVAFIAMALMIISTTVATRSLTASREHSHFEGAIAAAENGIDQALARAQTVYNLSGADTYVTPSTGITGDPTPDCNAAPVSWSGYPMPAQPTLAQEKAFARSVLNALPPSCVRVTSQGDYAFFKPSGRQTVYAMGWYPHKGAREVKSRLIKAEYLFVPYRPQAAVLAAGTVALGSSTTVTSAPPNDPALAGVHSNDTVTVSTGNPTVWGKVTSSNPSTASSNNFKSNTTTAVESMAKMRIPAVNAAAVWASNHDSDPPGGWYDLCADGKVREPDGAAPCGGTELVDVSDGGEFRGWSFNGSSTPKQWIAGSGLKQNGYSGTYYVNGADVLNNASNAGSAVPNLTVIVAAVSASCNKVGGNLSWSHTEIAAPSVPNLFFLAEQDLLTTSNFSAGSASGGTVVSGLFIAGDQIAMQTSSAGAYGSIITADECDPPDGTSLVDSSIIKNPSIYYDPNAQAPFVDVINTTLWLEYVG